MPQPTVNCLMVLNPADESNASRNPVFAQVSTDNHFEGAIRPGNTATNESAVETSSINGFQIARPSAA